MNFYFVLANLTIKVTKYVTHAIYTMLSGNHKLYSLYESGYLFNYTMFVRYSLITIINYYVDQINKLLRQFLQNFPW